MIPPMLMKMILIMTMGINCLGNHLSHNQLSENQLSGNQLYRNQLSENLLIYGLEWNRPELPGTDFGVDLIWFGVATNGSNWFKIAHEP